MINSQPNNNNKPLLFSLESFFESNQIDLLNPEYFPHNKSKKVEEYNIIRYPDFKNVYIENEIKGFIRHLILDLCYAPSTISGYMGCCVRTIARFFNENYLWITSVTDVDYEKLYSAYLEFLTDNGYPISYDNIYRINKDMTQITYSSKTQHVSGFTNFYKYIHSIMYPDIQNEYEKDIWDIRKLSIPFSTAVARKRYTINYTTINQTWLREAAKKYNYYRIQNRTMSAVLDDMKALRLFSEYLTASNSSITSLDALDRKEIEEFIKYLSLKGFATTTYNRRLSALRTFFLTGNLLDLEGFPSKPLIVYNDYRKIVHRLPKYFTENELKQINEHISELPIQIARMVFILENCGMRVSDICSSKIKYNGVDCLVSNNKSEYVFTYYMPKTHRYNTIPVSDIVGIVIKEAILESQKKYGDSCQYIFAKSVNEPISTETFSNHLNTMSKRNDLKCDDGTPLRIKGHTFRGTVATRFANCGINMDVIRMMLGQQKVGVLNHYVTIHGITMVECMREITEENNEMILNIGKSNFDENKGIDEPALLPLPNGRCAKRISSGICNHANACYTCRMFRPIAECLPIYKSHLTLANSNIAIAEIHGYERILEANQNLANSLIKIIKKIEDKDSQ